MTPPLLLSLLRAVTLNNNETLTCEVIMNRSIKTTLLATLICLFATQQAQAGLWSWFSNLSGTKQIGMVVALAAVAGGIYNAWKANKPPRPAVTKSQQPANTAQPQPVITSTHNQTIQRITLEEGTTLIIERGDITKSRVRAIVNAANEQLEDGGGVCGAIFASAGTAQLQAACNDYPVTSANGQRCPVGQARITDSFKLKDRGIQSIIHAVGPDCRVIHDTTQQNKLLLNAYTNALTLADQHNIHSIAFPFISSAIYAFPRERAARIALIAITNYIRLTDTTKISEIHYVLFSQEDFDLFCRTAQGLGLS